MKGMLVQRPDQATPFTRRDLARLLIASIVLIVGLTTVLASDIVPTRLSATLGQVATADIVAPRAATFTSDTLTQQARDAASAAVAPQYDYTPAKADAVDQAATVQLNMEMTPADAAFSATTVSDSARAALLKNAIPGLSDESQATLQAMLPSRWPTVRDEARRLLGQLEQSELRDSDLADTQANLAGLVLGGLQASERQLVAELIAPVLEAELVVQLRADRCRPAGSSGGRRPGRGQPQPGPGDRPEGRPDHRPSDWSRSRRMA